MFMMRIAERLEAQARQRRIADGPDALGLAKELIAGKDIFRNTEARLPGLRDLGRRQRLEDVSWS